MQKLNHTTNDRAQDEDWRRVYAELTSLRAEVDALMKPAATTPNTSPIAPLPPVFPPSAGTSVTPVEQAGIIGAANSFSPSDHAHEGVHSVAATGQPMVTGDATFSVSGGMLINQSGNNIDFSAVFGTILPQKITIANSPYAVGPGDFVIFVNTAGGTVTVQLQSPAANPGRLVVIGNRGTVNPVTVTSSVGTVIGITSIVNVTGFNFVWYISDGSDWFSFTNSTGN